MPTSTLRTTLVATAAALGDAVAEPPAPATRDAVLAAVDVTRQDPPSLAARRGGTGGGRARGAHPLLVAAALVVVALVAAGATAWWARGDVDRLEEVEQIATAPDAATVTLTGEDGGAVRVTASAELGRGLVVADGRAELVAELDLAGAVALGVTEEPAGGSPQPTGDILLVGELPA